MKDGSKNIVNQHVMWEERLAKKALSFLSLYMEGKYFNKQHFKDIIKICSRYFEGWESEFLRILQENDDNTLTKLVDLIVQNILEAIQNNTNHDFIPIIFNFIIEIAIKYKQEVFTEEDNEKISLLFNKCRIQLGVNNEDIGLVSVFACKIFHELLKQDFQKISNLEYRLTEDDISNTWFILLTQILPLIKKGEENSDIIRAEIISNLIYSFNIEVEPSILFQIEKTFPLFIIRYCHEGISKSFEYKTKFSKTLDVIFTNPTYTKEFIKSILLRSKEYRDVFGLVIRIITFYKPNEMPELFYTEIITHLVALSVRQESSSYKILFSQAVSGLIDLKYNQLFRSISFSSSYIARDCYNVKLLKAFLESDILTSLEEVNSLISNVDSADITSFLEVSPYYHAALEGDLQAKDNRDIISLNEKFSSLALHFISRYPLGCKAFVDMYPCFALELFKQLLKLGGAISYEKNSLRAVVSIIINSLTRDKKQSFAESFLDFISITYDISSLQEMPDICAYYSEIYGTMTKNKCIFYTNDSTVQYYQFFHKINLSEEEKEKMLASAKSEERTRSHANLIEFERNAENMADSLEISISSL